VTKPLHLGEQRFLTESVHKMKTRIEVAIVLALSLGKSAVYSLVALIAAITSVKGLGGSSVAINSSASEREWLDLTYQLLAVFFSFAPVALALYLVARDGSIRTLMGLGKAENGRNIAIGFLLAAVIGIPGLGLYLASRAMGLSVEVVANNLDEHWWTIPVLLLAAVSAAVLEEFVIVGYLFDRLGRIGYGKWSTILISATIRGSYHLYQGFGGFVGNLAMGIVFGWAYKRYGRLKPLVIAHFILDAVSFVGYSFAKALLNL